MDDIKKNLEVLRSKMAQVAVNCGREPSNITLVAISKTKSVTAIKSVFEINQKDFGENYVQEFAAKYCECEDMAIQWHFVGHLQRNKVKEIVGKVFLLHTLDNLKLAQTIEKICEEKKCQQNCLVQVNISAEVGKSGCDPKEIFSFFSELNTLKHVFVKGLMMIGTHTQDEQKTRQEFRELKRLMNEINSRQIYRNPLTELSMGMSGQFDIAIEEGATLIRVGSQIFGERK